MLISRLDKLTPIQIFHCFKEAFTNYCIPIAFNEDTHLSRWKNSGVDFALSYGAFEDEKLVGFVLHAPKDKEVFNLATGVIPTKRGQNIIHQIYEKAFPELRIKGFESTSLEVITHNTRALRVYQKAGFQKYREFNCYKGLLNLEHTSLGEQQYSVSSLNFTEEMEKLMPFPYSFEQSKNTLTNGQHQYELHTLRDHQTLLAYCIYFPASGSIMQFEAQKPFQQNARNLLHRMKLSGEIISMNNVDSRHIQLNKLFSSIGIKTYVTQFEMRLNLL